VTHAKRVFRAKRVSVSISITSLALLAALLLAAAALADEPRPTPTAAPQILHMPTLERRAEQGILRPVPLSAELPHAIALRARRVLVHYRLWGDPDWTTLELRRKAARYEGAIPCREISTVTGDLKYYIRVHDLEGRVIATGASRAEPYRVTIKHDTTLRTAQPRVAKCPDPADCPAGLPGCPSERVIEIACQSDRDCEGGSTCSWQGFCEKITRRHDWLTVAVQQDIAVVSNTGACSLAAQESQGYACYRKDGAQYTGTPVHTNEPLAIGAGPTRIVVAYDRLVFYDTTLGLRVGWAIAGEGPTPREGTSFVPFSMAARLTHWFGDDPFARPRLRPFAYVTGGYAMVDVTTTGQVREDPTASPYQGGNDLEQTVEIHKRAGDAFIGLGAGLAMAITPAATVTADLAIQEAFPYGALVLAPTLGASIGF
jgi:hypothetical protein